MVDSFVCAGDLGVGGELSHNRDSKSVGLKRR